MPSPTPSTTRSLLRALLRECTYLPDPLARTHWHTRITTRFRQHQAPLPPKRLAISAARQVPHLHQARQLLSTLRRANAGHLRPLEKILLHTYGRTGRRRHELLGALERLDGGSGAVAGDPGTEEGGAPKLLPHTVELVVKAQRARRAQLGARLARLPMKTLAPVLPATNIWGRPLPERRARNIRRRWVARARESVLPPLPREEWQRLGDLAAGTVQWGGEVPRRGKEKRGVGRVHGENPHRVTGRFMRRLWGRVFVQCPVMEEKEEGGWVVRWGKVEGGEVGRGREGRGSENLFLFEGVDEHGRRLDVR